MPERDVQSAEPAIINAVAHVAGATSATVPTTMNAAPITGTLRTE